MTNLGVIKEFISIALRERDAIRHALHVDKNNQKLQRKIKDWNTGEREGWFPCDGQTPKLLGQYRPSKGLGDFTKAYQESNATVIRVGAHTHLLPKLEAAYNAHEAYLNEASQAYEDSRTTLATFETHCATLNELINVVNAADNNADLGEHSEISKPDTRKQNKALDIPDRSEKAANAVEDEGKGDKVEEQAPALKKVQLVTLKTLARFDPSRLVTLEDIANEMPAAERYSTRTIQPAIHRLVTLGLAERPEGSRHGTRLTIKGRRWASRIAD